MERKATGSATAEVRQRGTESEGKGAILGRRLEHGWAAVVPVSIQTGVNLGCGYSGKKKSALGQREPHTWIKEAVRRTEARKGQQIETVLCGRVGGRVLCVFVQSEYGFVAIVLPLKRQSEDPPTVEEGWERDGRGRLKGRGGRARR